MTTKAVKAWAVKDELGDIKIKTISNTKRDSIIKYTEHVDWSWYESIGYSCVPVLITEIKE